MTEAARSAQQPRTLWNAEQRQAFRDKAYDPGTISISQSLARKVADQLDGWAEAAQQRGGLDPCEPVWGSCRLPSNHAGRHDAWAGLPTEAELVDALKYAAASTSQSLDTTPYADMAQAIRRRLAAAPQPSARLTPQRKPPADPRPVIAHTCPNCGSLHDVPPADPEPRWDPQEEHCHKCGRPVGVVWTAPDDLWAKVMGTPGGIRCIRCFDEEAETAGLPLLRWVPQPADIWPIPLAESRVRAAAIAAPSDQAEALRLLREVEKLEEWRHDPKVSVRRYAAMATGADWSGLAKWLRSYLQESKSQAASTSSAAHPASQGSESRPKVSEGSSDEG